MASSWAGWSRAARLGQKCASLPRAWVQLLGLVTALASWPCSLISPDCWHRSRFLINPN